MTGGGRRNTAALAWNNACAENEVGTLDGAASAVRRISCGGAWDRARSETFYDCSCRGQLTDALTGPNNSRRRRGRRGSIGTNLNEVVAPLDEKSRSTRRTKVRMQQLTGPSGDDVVRCEPRPREGAARRQHVGCRKSKTRLMRRQSTDRCHSWSITNVSHVKQASSGYPSAVIRPRQRRSRWLSRRSCLNALTSESRHSGFQRPWATEMRCITPPMQASLSGERVYTRKINCQGKKERWQPDGDKFICA
jgi:hypothetical protein